MAVHPLSLMSESFTLPEKRTIDWQDCKSEILDNCVFVFLYEGYLMNQNMCCFWCMTFVGSGDQLSKW